MAQLLTRLWPADKLVLGYFLLMGVIEVAWFRQIPEAWWLLTLHLIGALLILASTKGTGNIVRIFRHWYPLLFVASCYREMSFLIADIRHARADQALADLDYAFWHVNPGVWLERLYSPALTEFLQIVYTLFIPVALLVPTILWVQKRFTEFRYVAFLLSLGFLASYLGYIAVPARGPRFSLAHLQHVPLQGLWLFDSMQATLNRLEKDHYDCFPSGHTELTILALWSSRRLSKRIFWVYFLYTLCIVFATVYLRYHYTIDLLAGVLVALALIFGAPAAYRMLSGAAISEQGVAIGD